MDWWPVQFTLPLNRDGWVWLQKTPLTLDGIKWAHRHWLNVSGCWYFYRPASKSGLLDKWSFCGFSDHILAFTVPVHHHLLNTIQEATKTLEFIFFYLTKFIFSQKVFFHLFMNWRGESCRKRRWGGWDLSDPRSCATLICCSEEGGRSWVRRQSSGQWLLVNLCSSTHLWSWTLGHHNQTYKIQAAEIHFIFRLALGDEMRTSVPLEELLLFHKDRCQHLKKIKQVQKMERWIKTLCVRCLLDACLAS